jgi:hypothetical protein
MREVSGTKTALHSNPVSTLHLCFALQQNRQPMSALGQKQTFAMQEGMSALPSKADIGAAQINVRFVPIADIDVIRSPRRHGRARTAES